MRLSILFSINGPRTIAVSGRKYGLVKNKTVVGETGMAWASTEYSATNAWYVNGGSGVVNNNNNNNNKNNSNIVRAVCALNEKDKISWIEAFHDCIRHKLSSSECCDYRLAGEEDVLMLAYEAISLSYKPSISKCFCVTKPKLREVFAANFRDRIVHHWICLRLEPLFEKRFQKHGNVSYNCRKGYGVLKAVTDVGNKINEMKGVGWVMKLDLSGFFMSIDRTILWDKLKEFIENEYCGDDKEVLLYLTEKIVKHNPQNHCVKRGDVRLFAQLPDNKTLFKSRSMIGMPIGNLTSQLFANFYMGEFDKWIIDRTKGTDMLYARFVDDIIIVTKDKKTALSLIHPIRDYLDDQLHVHLHKKKFYLQPIRHGVHFVGHIIKPNRIYSNNTLIRNIKSRLRQTDRYCKKMLNMKEIPEKELYILKRHIASLNSYMGFMVHTSTYAIRREFLNHYKHLWIFLYFENRCKTFKIKRAYYIKTTINYHRHGKEKNNRHKGRKISCSTAILYRIYYRRQLREWRRFIKDHHITTRYSNTR